MARGSISMGYMEPNLSDVRFDRKTPTDGKRKGATCPRRQVSLRPKACSLFSIGGDGRGCDAYKNRGPVDTPELAAGHLFPWPQIPLQIRRNSSKFLTHPVGQMECDTILTAFLTNPASNRLLTPFSCHLLPALLEHADNRHGLARFMVTMITTQLRSLLDLPPAEGGPRERITLEQVQDAWFTAADRRYANNLQPSSPIVHMLATAYNSVAQTWATDFVLYPLGKRYHQLIKRTRKRKYPFSPLAALPPPPPPVVVEQHKNDKMIPRRFPLPRRSPQSTVDDATEQPILEDEADNGPSETVAAEDVDEDSGLDGCKVVNDHHDVSWLVQDHGYYYPLHHHYQRRQSNASETFSESWTLTSLIFNEESRDGEDESLLGDALSLRARGPRRRMINALAQRDGPGCAISKVELQRPQDSYARATEQRVFCTQIIPESHDTARFQRFKHLVSVYFEKKYDALLDSKLSSSSEPLDVDKEFEMGFAPYHGPSTTPSKRRGHYYATSTNVLQTSRNAVLMSEKWMRWFDEGRFVLRESGGQFYVHCMDPTLENDPEFTRQTRNGIERVHGARLDIGATSIQFSRPATKRHTRHSSLHDLPPISTIIPPHPIPTVPHHASSHSASHVFHNPLPTPIPTPPSPPFHYQLPALRSVGPQSTMPMAAPTAVHNMSTPVASRLSPAYSVHRGSAHASHRTPPATYRVRRAPYPPPVIHGGPITSPPSSRRGSEYETATMSPPPPRTKWNQLFHTRRRNSVASVISTGDYPESPLERSSHHSAGSFQGSYTPVTPSTGERHSLRALLNPVRDTEPRQESGLHFFPPLMETHDDRAPSPLPSAPPPRRELWDVDALDPNLVRLHELIVRTWWASGLGGQMAAQIREVDEIPLECMNVVVLGQDGFSSHLKHRLSLL
ncbi:SubName: Full=Uncharacterized protein {ECO:0000313/EMBL:CCA71967.1} [Serendipita indica DSM 11827]|nr:SubName: Full=Uncharacterized protein {ECO:0000313/EMBL:CCA71967.1} [Serendipita indica DSM 11827]